MKQILWTREEYILVLDLYFQHRYDRSASENPKLAEYSALLRKLHGIETSYNPKFRSTNSIAMRMHNFKACDPHWHTQGVSGMRDGAKGVTMAIWIEFQEHPEDVSQIAEEIRRSLLNNEHTPSNLNSEKNNPVTEGKRQLRIHYSRERKPQRIPKLKAFKLAHDSLFCEVCGGDYAHYDEPVRERVFEVHHDVPLAIASHQIETKLDDLSVLCANCHRAIHGYDQVPTIEEMRENLRRE